MFICRIFQEFSDFQLSNTQKIFHLEQQRTVQILQLYISPPHARKDKIFTHAHMSSPTETFLHFQYKISRTRSFLSVDSIVSGRVSQSVEIV